MADHYWLTENQLERIKPYFPRSHGKPRVDDGESGAFTVDVFAMRFLRQKKLGLSETKVRPNGSESKNLPVESKRRNCKLS
jgi:hypothetical protein